MSLCTSKFYIKAAKSPLVIYVKITSCLKHKLKTVQSIADQNILFFYCTAFTTHSLIHWFLYVEVEFIDYYFEKYLILTYQLTTT